MAEVVNLQAAAKPVDLTPAMVIGNWQAKSAEPVLIVNPLATFHQRAALTWVTASDTLNILEASQSAHGNDRAILCVAIERMHQLERMLSDIGDRKAAMELKAVPTTEGGAV